MEMTSGLINVAVAAVWTDAASPREIDAESLKSPVNIPAWLDALTTEQRKALCDDKLVQTQLLYGERVLVLDKKGEWAYVVIPEQASKKDERGYPGWVPLAQITEVQQTELEKREELPIVVVTAKKTTMHDAHRKPILEVSYNTILPLIKEKEDFYEVHTPDGTGFIHKKDASVYSSFAAMQKGSGNDIVQHAERFKDLLYLWGGMSAYGYDCSGFSYNMLKANGYLIPRDATDQAEKGQPIKKEQAAPGDLLFFAYEEGKGALHHVGIYYGDGKMIHSPTPGKKIEIQTIAGTFYEKEWCETRRYWQ
ncbi:NlpC/P60 family protein [Jeotgalibacillus soli]|uniref:Peptidase n=1 Tax=Jeotgalibacillus soli TaxID=889306 RepID=A0A0C2RH85_9BACL|nr:NlpC/P60 family protein [Jeotgalibacillus soli]KIL49500.1 peptidase [Jeotgalibacillus soli]